MSTKGSGIVGWALLCLVLYPLDHHEKPPMVMLEWHRLSIQQEIPKHEMHLNPNFI